MCCCCTAARLEHGLFFHFFSIASERALISEAVVATNMTSAAELRGAHAGEIDSVFIAVNQRRQCSTVMHTIVWRTSIPNTLFIKTFSENVS